MKNLNKAQKVIMTGVGAIVLTTALLFGFLQINDIGANSEPTVTAFGKGLGRAYYLEAPIMNAIEAGTNPTISGIGNTVLTGTVVIITLPNDEKITVVVDITGNWTIKSPITLVHGDIIKAEQKDIYGQVSLSTETRVEDTTLPDAPTLNAIEAGTNPTISGGGEAGAVVTITLPNDEKITAVVDATGNWTIESPITLIGGDVVKTEQTDAYGNMSAPTETSVEDTTLPDAPMLNAIEAGANPTISGGGEAGATITITLANDEKITVVVDATGNWTIESPITLVDGDVVKTEQTDTYGNTSPSTETRVEDTTAPDAPMLNAIEAGANPTISGGGEAGATITITLANDEKITVVVDATGNWTIESPITLVDGDVVKTEQTDTYGNTSPSTETRVEDTTAPDAPTLNAIEAGTNPTISGGGEVGEVVTITLPNDKKVTTVVDTTGNWTIESPITLVDGDVVKTEQTDVYGNTSPSTETRVEDTTAPDAPMLNTIEAGTNPTISGYGEAGAIIVITLPDAKQIATIVDVIGNWTIESPITLVDGDVVKTEQTDANNNISLPTETTVKDTTLPDAPTLNTIEAGTNPTISGYGEVGAVITITLPNAEKIVTRVDTTGNWTIESPITLVDGDVVKVEQTDTSDNTSPSTETSVKDTTAPVAPKLNAIEAGTNPTISGYGEVGTVVTITLPNDEKITTVVDETGNWTIESPITLVDGDVVKTEQTDAYNNISSPTETTVKDTTAPVAPKLNAIEAGANPTIRGTGEAGAVVIITLPNNEKLTAVVDATGNWIKTSPITLVDGDVVKAEQTDAYGNTSTSIEEIITEKPKTEMPVTSPTVNGINPGDTTISGKAEPNVVIGILLPNGTVLEGNTDANGNFTVNVPEGIELAEGDQIHTIAVDENGATSAPAITTVTDTISPVAPTINEVEVGEKPTLSGGGEPGATVTITLPNGEKITTIVDENGNWIIESPIALLPGNQIVVTQTDSNGNTSVEVETTITETIQTSYKVTGENISMNITEYNSKKVDGTLENHIRVESDAKAWRQPDNEEVGPVEIDLSKLEEVQVNGQYEIGISYTIMPDTDTTTRSIMEPQIVSETIVITITGNDIIIPGLPITGENIFPVILIGMAMFIISFIILIVGRRKKRV